MTFSNINVSSPNDGLGDKLRDAFVIVNDNFIEVENFLVSQVTDSYLSATLSNYVTNVTFDSTILSLGEGFDNLQGQINNKAALVHTHIVTDVTGLQGQLDSKATLTQLNNAISALNDTIATLNITLAGKIDEAPIDDNSYVRKNGAWIIL